jgi:hypothetical protein
MKLLLGFFVAFGIGVFGGLHRSRRRPHTSDLGSMLRSREFLP